MRRDKPETQEFMWHFFLLFSSRRSLKSPAARELDRKKDFPKCTFDLQRALTKRSDSWQDLVRERCSLTRGGRSCSWALYRSPPCTIVGCQRDSTVLGKPKKQRSVKTWKKNVNEEAKKKNQTQLKTTGRDVKGEKKNIDNQAKNMKNAVLKVSAQN